MNVLDRTKPPVYSNEYKTTATRDELVARSMLLGRHVIDEWEHGGHLFRIDAMAPKLVGATIRKYELFCDSEPAYGGRYHSDIEHARERAGFIAQDSMAAQITYLWGLVDKQRKELEALK